MPAGVAVGGQCEGVQHGGFCGRYLGIMGNNRSTAPAMHRYIVVVRLWNGEMRNEKAESRKQNFASKREQRQAYLDSAEREQSQDRRAGLKEKGEIRYEK